MLHYVTEQAHIQFYLRVEKVEYVHSKCSMTDLKRVNDLHNCDAAFWEMFNCLVREPIPSRVDPLSRSRRMRVTLPTRTYDDPYDVRRMYDKANPVIINYKYIRIWRTSYRLIDPDTNISIKSSSVASRVRCETKCRIEELKRGGGISCLRCGSWSKTSCGNCLRCTRVQFDDPKLR